MSLKSCAAKEVANQTQATVLCDVSFKLFNKYSPKWKWLVVDICFSIY